jgi:hypothetical protein
MRFMENQSQVGPEYASLVNLLSLSKKCVTVEKVRQQNAWRSCSDARARLVEQSGKKSVRGTVFRTRPLSCSKLLFLIALPARFELVV